MSAVSLGRQSFLSREAATTTGGSAKPADTTSTVQSIATYIPSDVLTVYIAAIAAFGTTTVGSPEAWAAFVVFLIASPVAVWASFATSWRASNSTLPLSPRQWPSFAMAASLLAFAAWAFALPQTPFAVFGWYNSAIAGLVVLITLTVLGVARPLFGPLPKPAAAEAGG